MRTSLSITFSILIIALFICFAIAKLTKKSVGNDVAFLIFSMALPVIGNLIIITSTDQLAADAGYYIYFLGVDAAVYSIWRFTHSYCELGKPKPGLQALILSLFGLDFVHYLLNPFLSLSFSTEAILVDGRAYYSLIPHIGQVYHRVICYGLFFVILIIFAVKTQKAPKIFTEKYGIILFSMIATAAVETYYIFSRQPLDMSMIGFGLFGILVYFFALRYRPMKLLDQMLAGYASDTSEALFFFDENGSCIWTNGPGRRLIGVAEDNYKEVKANLSFLFGDIDYDADEWFKDVTLGSGDETIYTHLAMRAITDADGKKNGSYLSVRDNTEEQREIKLEMYNSTHDSLTDLYTKEYLYESIAKRLRIDSETHYMIGYIEVSNFKLINDVFGREFGNYTIKQIAEFIRENSTGKHLCGRLSDDSFGVLIDGSDFHEKTLTERLGNFTVKDDNLEHRILIRFGIYDIRPGDEIDVPLFFDSARLASAMISDDYHDPVVYYDDKIREAVIHDQLISNQLKEAIASKQIRPYLQPIVDSQGLLAGAEALVRWLHPDEGLMPPGMFIPVFERNGLIAELDRYMWRCACEILSDWKARGIENFISVNISPKDFYYMDVVSQLKDLVEEFNIDPARLRIEITETAMMTDAVDILNTVNELKRYGFIVEMDDFGSGYSSLNLLKNLDIDVIKIDMQFLKDSESNMKAGMIIKNIINMSEDIGMSTLTEGVETAKQYEKLYAMGCKLYQGYYFSKPVPVDEFEKQWFD